MVNPAEFKTNVEKAISQKYKIEFLGDNFDLIVNLLTDAKAEAVYRWIEKVISKKIQPIVIGSKKTYKGRTISELLTFRYPFNIDNNEYRILFVKVKNSIYIEFHLGNHKYYDKVRKDLDFKKTSY